MGKLHEEEMRKVYALTLNELIEENPQVMVVEADLSKASGTNPTVLKEHPKNFVNVGVSEANMICIGAGLASEGKIPFCASFTCFASRRVYDQATISVAYANNNVKIIGTAPGITAGPNGGTHMCFQDLAIMRVMPNMHVYSPCDVYELRAVLHHMAANKQPTYMQLIRSKIGKIFDEDYTFNPRKAVVVKEGKDITLISTGYMTHIALKSLQELDKQGIDAELIHYPSIKPFDENSLIMSAEKTNGVITIENQNILGGLGGVVCETLSEHYPTKVKRLGIPDKFGEVATAEYLLNKHKTNVSHIINAAKDMLRRSDK